MRARVMVLLLALVGCSSDPSGDEPAGVPAGEVAPAEAAPAKAAPAEDAVEDPSAIPEDWVCVTDTKGRFEIGMPTLPRSLTSAQPGAERQRLLLAERDGATYAIVSEPVLGPNMLEELEQSLRSAGTVSERASWRGQGFGLMVSSATQVVRARAVVDDDRLYSLEVTGASAADAGRFFDSFEVRAEPRREAVHDSRLGYRVQAPTCMNRWRDVSDLPPLVGHHGVLDGHQLAVNVNDLLLVLDPEVTLDGSVREMRRTFDGELVKIDPQPFEGQPSRRLEVRARDGTYGTIRLLLAGSRLYQASVYAPSGHEAPWADAYVDSLSVGP